MMVKQPIPWGRILAESVAIVASILLAFAIDAWWQRRSEVEQAGILTNNLLTDFRASQRELERALSEHGKNQQVAIELLEAVRSAELGTEITVRMEAVLGTMMSPSYSPTTSALELALSTGQIDLIESTELRNALAAWQQRVADNAEEEADLAELATLYLRPQISRQVRLGGSLNHETIADWRAGEGGNTRFGEAVRLRVTSELEGHLGQRTLLGNFIVQELTEIGRNQAEILDLLGNNE